MILLQAAKGENGMKRKRGFSLVLCLFLLSCLLPQAVGAERIDPERECSLTVELFEDGAPVEGFPFGLFMQRPSGPRAASPLRGISRTARWR